LLVAELGIRQTVRDAMPALFEQLKNEQKPSVCAVLGNWMFG